MGHFPNHLCAALLVAARLLVAAAAGADGLSTLGDGLVWPGAIEALERRLADDDVEVRRTAAVDLSRLPASVQRRLLPRLFSDPDPEVRLAVADAALAIRLPEAGARVVKWLSDSDARVREAAAEVLAVLRYPGSVAGLGRVLEDPEPSVRMAAALALGNSQNAEASLFLLGHLDDGDPEVRRAVIAALEDLGDRRAVVPLIGRIQEQRAALRRQAAAALGSLGDQRAASALIVALADGDAAVRAAAATSLGQLRAEDAVWSLGALLETEADPEVQGAVLDALGSIGSANSVDAMLRTLAHQRTARARIERALARAGEVALPSLERCVFQPPEPGTGESCAAALGTIGGARAARVVEQALRQGVVTPSAALDALGRARDASALPTVLEYLTSATPAERRAAIDAAGKLLVPDERLGIAVEPIASALGSARGASLEQAALVALLGRTGSARAAPSLMPLARSSDEYLRAIALEALGQIGPSGADSVLLGALDSASFPTRWTAAIALRRVGRHASLGPLLDRLDRAPWAEREALAVALAGPVSEAPSATDLERILGLVHAGPGALKDALIEALARVPGAAGAATLERLIPGSAKATRAKLAEALGAHVEGRATLRQLTRDLDASVRANAVWSLGAVGSVDDAALLLELLGDRDVAVAANAVGALASLSLRERYEGGAAFCSALGDPRSYVLANALAGLRLTGSSCKDTEGPVWLLEHHPADEVRAAAARLIRDRPEWATGVAGALQRCVQKDVSGSVAAECAHPVGPKPDAASTPRVAVAVLVVPTGANSPDPLTPFSLVRSDGLIRSGTSDRRGSVFEGAAPRGALRLTVPAVFSE